MATEFFEVHTSMTNSTEGSSVYVDINTTPICSNMSNKEFRALIMQLRDKAVRLVDDRCIALTRDWSREQNRVYKWFGRRDDELKHLLIGALPKLRTALQELMPQKIVRYDDELNVHLSCTPAPNDPGTSAAVCKPDSAKRVIAIYPEFCELPSESQGLNSKLKTLIHECTHYVDTFDSDDLMYGSGLGISIWGRRNPGEAANNADSITCYIVVD